MVAPVSGPFSEAFGGSYTVGSRIWFRQKPPYNLVLGYLYGKSYGKNTLVVDHDDFYSNVSSQRSYQPAEFYNDHYSWTVLRNKAYEALMSSMNSSSAGWAENLAQANKSRDMIVNRMTQMGRFVGHLRRGRFKSAALALKTPVPRNVSTKKAISQNFLEYEYGLKPLMSDVQSSIEFLSTDFGAKRIRGQARSGYTNKYAPPQVPGWATSGTIVEIVNQRVKCYANVRITNPNLFAARQLGLIDFALPWKLLPFSFVVDWFGNVEQVLSSFSDLYGVQLENPGTTEAFEGHCDEAYTEFRLGEAWKGGDPSKYQRHLSTYNATTVRIHRSSGIPTPTLIFPPFKGFSVRRGAQAAALIFAVLGK